MAISDFRNFEFLTPKMAKMYIFWKNVYKIKIFKNFKKPEYMSENYLSRASIPNFKLLTSFLTFLWLNMCTMR